MFTLRWFYQLHTYLIATGVITLFAALYIIRYKKDKPWRVKRHKFLTLVAISLILIGILTMFIGKQSIGLPHFTVPHAFGGITALTLMIIAPILATIGMKGNKKAMNLHRWVGRIAGITVFIVSIIGTTIILSYL